MKFSEMPYERPDIEQMKQDVDALCQALAKATSYEEARDAFLKKDKWERHIMSLRALVTIRHDIDTRDAYYDEESHFWNRTMPLLGAYDQKWNELLLNSPYREEFAKEFGEIVFTNLQLKQKTFKPEIIPEMQRENEVVDAYQKLIASAQIPFQGGVYTLSQLTPFKNSLDDDIRLAAWKAEGQWYKDHQDKLDEYYDELVHLRDTIGKKMGNENYIPVGYARMNRNCYDQKDVEKFREYVVKYVVPLADELHKVQAKRIGKSYPLTFSDNQLDYVDGNEAPKGDANDIVQSMKVFFEDLSPETGAFFNDMLDHETFDLLSTEGKRSGGYTTGIPDYEIPFVYTNFNGTQHDVEVMAHECGHAFCAWLNRKRIPLSTLWPSLDACEVHSMSMEFFAWLHAEDFFDDVNKFEYSHLGGSVCFIPYGTMVDHFQHEVYEHPQMSPRQRHDVWKKLLGIYMPWLKLDGDIPFYAQGEGWQRQHHIYTSPFYYIDYCLAQTISLEFWALIQEDKDKAWKHYMDYTSLGGSMTFLQLLEAADLESPFAPDTLKNVCEKANAWLSEHEPKGNA